VFGKAPMQELTEKYNSRIIVMMMMTIMMMMMIMIVIIIIIIIIIILCEVSYVEVLRDKITCTLG